MTAPARRIAILGGGIMGVCLALFLARRGQEVSLFEREPSPLQGASRWNEGKIHLGYLYGADRRLGTARLLLPGGLLFSDLVSDLIGFDVAPHSTNHDDIYLIHRKSAVATDQVRRQFAAVTDLVRQSEYAKRYLVDVSGARTRELSKRELDAIADTAEIVSAFAVPERSVNTQWVADRLNDAISSDKRITLHTNVTVTQACPVESTNGPWHVIGQPDLRESFDIVVNALWEGRLAVDLTAGLHPEAGWSHRYRLSVFARTSQTIESSSAVIAVGPFGDIKNYNGRDFYLSWYPTGLIAEALGITLRRPDPLTVLEERAFVREVSTKLAELIPGVADLFADIQDARVRGGFVFAQGQGSLSDPNATLHRRDRFGVRQVGNYFSVDTGKYSTAPWLAANLASVICGS